MVVGTDSTAARGMTSRLGAGRVRHLEAKYLWIQQYVLAGEMKVIKISTTDNRADMQTKPLDPARHWTLLRRLPMRVLETGRSRTCLAAVVMVSCVQVSGERRVTTWSDGGGAHDFDEFIIIRVSSVLLLSLGAVLGIMVSFFMCRAVPAICSRRQCRRLRRGGSVEAGTQTDSISLHYWWEESHNTLKTEARARGLDSGLLKTELIKMIVEHDVCHRQ